MTHTQSTKVELPEVQAELDRHELLYAERQSLKAGDVVAVLESLMHRHGVIHLALLAMCCMQIALVVDRLASDGDAGSSRVAWPNIIIFTCCAAIAAYEQSTIRRCKAALDSLRGKHDAR